MPKQKKTHNRTKRIQRVSVNNSNTVNIGRAPGINTASVKGMNKNTRKINNFRSNNSSLNNVNLQNSNFYKNVGNFSVNKNSDYDVIYKSVPKISSEDLYEKIYRKIDNLPNNVNNVNNNNNYDYDSLKSPILKYKIVVFCLLHKKFNENMAKLIIEY